MRRSGSILSAAATRRLPEQVPDGSIRPAGNQPRTGEAVADDKRVAVLVSGHGSNLQALLEEAAEPGSGMAVVLVAADRPGAHGLERARRAGVDTAVVRPADHPDRPSFDLALRDLVAAARPDVVCLAGFMRILGPGFVRAFPDRILNTHPSLLPSFRGAHAVPEALAAGVKVTGCTIHLVDDRGRRRPDPGPGGGARSSPATTRTASTSGSRPWSTGSTPGLSASWPRAGSGPRAAAPDRWRPGR